ncbi:MAG: hypothetical protein HeimC2_36430 [Candidatus Heimdallarchaeota archaeon LC_2]|nr:MAG: hypothetical protein HeimC2_36430 [Candidatus Heimdallarchaeota archaeon LC_2]
MNAHIFINAQAIKPTMGRRPMGRKYAKHISIQVKEEHNEDLKLLASKLSNSSSPPNGKLWTIRDIILTLLYTQFNNSTNWFVKNHFEKLSESDLIKIRKNIFGDNKIDYVPKNSMSKPKKIKKQKEKLKLKLNPKYANYQQKMAKIRQEDLN